MDVLTTLSENSGFLASTYSGGFQPIFILLGVFAIIDVILKAFALWRAARMQKLWWFIALLIVNSVGILPLIYLLMTKKEYVALQKSKKENS